MFLTNHSSAFLLHDVRVVKNVACLSSLLCSVTYFCVQADFKVPFSNTFPTQKKIDF